MMRNRRGFTLVEMLISLVIASLVIAVAYKVFTNQAIVYSVQEAVAEAQNSARAGMEIMFSDLRLAGYDKEGGGSNVGIGTAVSGTANSIRVEWEHDNDTIKAVEYFLADGKLVRNVYMNGLLTADSPEEVVDDVAGLVFTYTLSGTKITRADISLTISTRPVAVGLNNPEPLTRTSSSTVYFRNA